MTIELFEAHEKWLPQFKGHKPRKLEIIDTKPVTKPAEVPLDPALAIANRFGKLAG
jgi:alpha-galactosidase